jgi:hypothetical protein
MAFFNAGGMGGPGMQPGVILLREGTDESQGKGQLISNINACQAIAEAVKTTLGPRGMDKLIHDGTKVRAEGRVAREGVRRGAGRRAAEACAGRGSSPRGPPPIPPPRAPATPLARASARAAAGLLTHSSGRCVGWAARGAAGRRQGWPTRAGVQRAARCTNAAMPPPPRAAPATPPACRAPAPRWTARTCVATAQTTAR